MLPTPATISSPGRRLAPSTSGNRMATLGAYCVLGNLDALVSFISNDAVAMVIVGRLDIERLRALEGMSIEHTVCGCVSQRFQRMYDHVHNPSVR